MVVITGFSRPSVDGTATDARLADILFIEMIVGDAQQVPLDLGADHAGVALFDEFLE